MTISHFANHFTHISLPPIVGQLISVPLHFKKKLLEVKFKGALVPNTLLYPSKVT